MKFVPKSSKPTKRSKKRRALNNWLEQRCYRNVSKQSNRNAHCLMYPFKLTCQTDLWCKIHSLQRLHAFDHCRIATKKLSECREQILNFNQTAAFHSIAKKRDKETSAMFAKYRPSEPRMIAIMMVMIVKLEKCRSLPVRGENTGNLGSHNKNGTRINSIALVESCTCIIAFAQPSNRTNAFLYDVNHFVAEYSTVIDELHEHFSLSPVVDNRLFC